jgi:hypothetical protein
MLRLATFALSPRRCFELRRVSGSHHVFAHPDIPQLINLQAVRGQAKPYQIRQLVRLVERYDLRLKDRP